MSTLATQLTALTLLTIAVGDDASSSTGLLPPPDKLPSISWSAPPEGRSPALGTWIRAFSHELQPVLAAWVHFRRRLQGELPALFNPQCIALVDSLKRLDHTVVLPAPDLLIDLYVRRLMAHLDAAAIACQRHELYNVVYRFDEAGRALAEIRWLLERRGIAAQ